MIPILNQNAPKGYVEVAVRKGFGESDEHCYVNHWRRLLKSATGIFQMKWRSLWFLHESLNTLIFTRTAFIYGNHFVDRRADEMPNHLIDQTKTDILWHRNNPDRISEKTNQLLLQRAIRRLVQLVGEEETNSYLEEIGVKEQSE